MSVAVLPMLLIAGPSPTNQAKPSVPTSPMPKAIGTCSSSSANRAMKPMTTASIAQPFPSPRPASAMPARNRRIAAASSVRAAIP